MPVARVIERNGLPFRIWSSVRPEGSTYLLVHGIGVSHRYLARLHDVLAEGASVHSVDLPGFGGMPKPSFSPTVREMAAALAAVVRAAGLGPVVAVGHSMGTQWVTELALADPDLVSHVVQLGPVVDDRHRGVWAQTVALGLDTLRETPRGNALVLTDYLRAGPVWYARQLREMLAYPLERTVPELVQPLLVVRGGRDPVAGRAWSRRIRDAAARAALVEVPGAPHLVQHVASRAVADAIGSFLEGGLDPVMHRSVAPEEPTTATRATAATDRVETAS